jgi:hypothetical protein
MFLWDLFWCISIHDYVSKAVFYVLRLHMHFLSTPSLQYDPSSSCTFFSLLSYLAKGANTDAPELKRLVAGFPPRRPGFAPRSGQVRFVVDEVALGQVFSEYFGFHRQSSFLQILHPHNHPGRYNRPEVADVPSGPSLDSTPHYAN